MRIKHSKYKNTGLIYELLVRQITSDLLAQKNSQAVNILRRYFSKGTPLFEEYNLYKNIVEGTNLDTTKADLLINASLKAGRHLDKKNLQEAKYKLIAEVRNVYDLEQFFSVPVPNYKTLAAFYCLLEAERGTDLVDPQFLVNNKVTLLEHMTSRFQPKAEVRDALIEEYSNYDKDLRLLAFKILLEKFNDRYANLLPEQKAALRQIISLGYSKKLRDFINEEYSRISKNLKNLMTRMPRGVEKIKLNEAIKIIEPLDATTKVSDDHVIKLLQFYDLLSEVQNVLD